MPSSNRSADAHCATAPCIDNAFAGFPVETGQVAVADGVVHTFFAYPCSLVQLPTGRLMATFTGMCRDERGEGVGCYSGDGGRTWSRPETFFGGGELSETSLCLEHTYADPTVTVVNERRVLLCCMSRPHVTDDQLDLSHSRLWRRVSDDGGESFGPVEELPKHRKYMVGTVHSGIRLATGRLILGYSWDVPAEEGRSGSGEGSMDLRSGVLISEDDGQTWRPGEDIAIRAVKGDSHLPHSVDGLVEPAVVELNDGSLFLLGRTGTNRLWQSRSCDGGDRWEEAGASVLESHNCPAALLRLKNGRVVVAYNAHPLQRSHMSLRVSDDNCESWSEPVLFAPIGHTESPEASYPQICELPGGDLLVIFGQNDSVQTRDCFSIRWARFAGNASRGKLCQVPAEHRWKKKSDGSV